MWLEDLLYVSIGIVIIGLGFLYLLRPKKSLSVAPEKDLPHSIPETSEDLGDVGVLDD